MSPEDIENRFTFHPATLSTAHVHDKVRARCKSLAESLNEILPEGREKALAITKLEEAMFWSNAAIARQKD